MRVAISQFATTSSSQENLATCIRMIDEMATCQPSLIVLPEFCNTLSWHVDHDQAWNEALIIGGPFLQSIAEQAIKHDCYIVINVTLRRELARNFSEHKKDGSIKSNISVTSCLFSPLGKLIHQADKQTLTGHEKEFFISANDAAKVISTPFGKLGLLTGNDSFNFASSRDLALAGAQLLCNSISSFALDQGKLHDAARACENKVFFITANKVGSLLPAELLQEQLSKDQLSQQQSTHLSIEAYISQEDLVGAGQSQIIAPDGKVLAIIDNNQEGYAFADIDLAGAGFDNQFRPDGTELIKQRRPELYQQLTAAIKQTPQHKKSFANMAPIMTNIAIFATYTSNEKAIEDVCHYIENNLSDIIQLPELFFVTDKTITDNAEQREQISRLSNQVIEQVSAVLRPLQYLCTSLVIEGNHQAVIISEHGLLAAQSQLHFCKRYQWASLAEEFNLIELTLEQGNINLIMLTADDVNIPEIVNLAALHDIHLLLVPFDIQEPCEVKYNLVSRAAENRICIVAASREKSFVNDLSVDNSHNNIYSKNKVKAQKSTGLIVNLTTESSLLPLWKVRKFNGYLNQPLVKLQYGKITKAVIHPIAAETK